MNAVQTLKDIDIRKVNRAALVDISRVHINEAMPCAERKLDYVRQIKNPYCFLVDGVVVQISFDTKGPQMADCMKNIILKA
jgi:hypothetical protein